MRLSISLMAICLLCLTPNLASADYDEGECPGNSCEAPGQGGQGGDGGDGGDGGSATATATNYDFSYNPTSSSSNSSVYAPDYSFRYNPSSAYSNSSANALSFQEQYNSMYQGQGQGFNAFNGNTTTTTIAPGLGEGIKEAAKANAKRANRAPDPAAAVAEHCDTTGFTAQTGFFGGGSSTPTFPCEILRTNQVKAELSGFWQNGVLRFLLNTRLLFKGIISWVPIIGS